MKHLFGLDLRKDVLSMIIANLLLRLGVGSFISVEEICSELLTIGIDYSNSDRSHRTIVSSQISHLDKSPYFYRLNQCGEIYLTLNPKITQRMIEVLQSSKVLAFNISALPDILQPLAGIPVRDGFYCKHCGAKVPRSFSKHIADYKRTARGAIEEHPSEIDSTIGTSIQVVGSNRATQTNIRLVDVKLPAITQDEMEVQEREREASFMQILAEEREIAEEKKGKFCAEEDEILLESVYSEMKKIERRSEKSLLKRCLFLSNVLSRGKWTESEDKALWNMVHHKITTMEEVGEKNEFGKRLLQQDVFEESYAVLQKKHASESRQRYLELNIELDEAKK